MHFLLFLTSCSPLLFFCMSGDVPKHRLTEIARRQCQKTFVLSLSDTQWYEIMDYLQGLPSTQIIGFKETALFYMEKWNLVESLFGLVFSYSCYFNLSWQGSQKKNVRLFVSNLWMPFEAGGVLIWDNSQEQTGRESQMVSWIRTLLEQPSCNYTDSHKSSWGHFVFLFLPIHSQE